MKASTFDTIEPMKTFHLLTLFLVSILSMPASALPDQSVIEAKKWLKSHPFFEAELQYYSLPPQFSAQRKLKSGATVSAAFSYGGLSTDESKLTIYDVVLSVSNTKKEIPNAWTKGNPTGEKLLFDIFGSSLLNDFKYSEPVYSGIEYDQIDNSDVGRIKITTLVPHPELSKNPYHFEIRKIGHVKFYIGSEYAYEIGEDYLRVFTIRDLDSEIDILKTNRYWFNKYIKYTKQHPPPKDYQK